MSEPLVLPEYGPTLPELVRRRFGWRERTTVAVLVAVAALIVVALLLVRPEVDSQTKYVHHEAPVFNLLYDNGALREVAPQGDEIVRLEGRRGRLAAAIAVEPLELPGATGDVAHGVLPAYASDHVQELRAALPGFELVQEGRARVNGAPGYEVRFRTGRTFGNDLMILPSEEEAGDALLVKARRTVSGRRKLGKREREFDKLVAKAYRSFKYGTAAK
ncbi:MAG TPA: hypothetical protein VFX51_10010 [Solirubrobacteraceae bacterium]|nr:hypothetical protein [Solirubrobacteraceae bacterium]